jgi:glycosyltransferase involved in cell wall biosynthesis
MTCACKVLTTHTASLPETANRVSEGCLDPSTPFRVFIMDLWCYTPYYDRYLCEGLAGENVEPILGSVSPYQDPQYFRRNGLRNDPGFVDVVPKLRISNDNVRRVLMLAESCINMAALLVRFAVAKPEILHVQWTPLVRRLPFEIWFLRLVKRLKIKLVYTVHNVLPHDTAKRFAPVFRRLYQEMDGLICHTDEAKGRLVREFSVDPEHVWVIPHGPLLHDAKRSTVRESKRRLLLSEDEILVVWQGIVRSYKGLDFLLEAWSRVGADSLKTRLLIAGTGESRLLGEIKETVVRLNLHKSVRLDLRFILDEELPTYYQAADILVYPYREVTTSGALMTALALQKPIVATRLPAFEEVLRDRETAVLVKYGDVDALAGALTRLIQSPLERERLARATALSRRFDNSWASIARATRQCYSAVLNYGSCAPCNCVESDE